MRIIHVMFDGSKFALYKHVLLFQFDSTFTQYTFFGTFTDMEMFTNFLK